MTEHDDTTSAQLHNTTSAQLHKDSIIIDGLVISRWSRQVFEAMHEGGLTAANCTCSVWEGFRDTMINISQWQRWFREHADIITQICSTTDIRAAKRDGKVGIILGWQNTSALEDRVEFVELFKRLGVGVMQLTYNTQNLVGSGCWESQDAGLSDFGREVIHEMNRVGVLVDLSHVGAATSHETILHSNKPVSYTHCCPTGLKDYPRNKTDEQLKLIADRGGFVGVATYPPFLPWGDDTTVDHCVQVFDYMVNLVGEDAVGVGTDFTQDQDVAFFQWLRSDKGHGRVLVPGTPRVPQLPHGFGALNEYPLLTEALLRHGWPEGRIRKIMGENWLRMLGEVWNE